MAATPRDNCTAVYFFRYNIALGSEDNNGVVARCGSLCRAALGLIHLHGGSPFGGRCRGVGAPRHHLSGRFGLVLLNDRYDFVFVFRISEGQFASWASDGVARLRQPAQRDGVAAVGNSAVLLDLPVPIAFRRPFHAHVPINSSQMASPSGMYVCTSCSGE